MLSSLERKAEFGFLADTFLMCEVYMMGESSECRLFVAWGKTRIRKDDMHQFPYPLVSLRHAHQSMQPFLPTTSQYISWQTDSSYLALGYRMWVLFQRQRQEILLPSLETCNKRHNGIRTCWVYQCVPGKRSHSSSQSCAYRPIYLTAVPTKMKYEFLKLA